MTPDVAPNLGERLFLRIAAAGFPAEMFLRVTLAAAPDVAALRRALYRTMNELPRLRTRVRVRPWGIDRRLVALGEDEAGARLEAADDDAAEERFHARVPALETEPPVRALLVRGRTLVLAVHHSVSDGQGALHVLERWGAHYGALLEGTHAAATESAGSARYREFFRTLAPEAKRRVLRRLAAPLLPSAGGSDHNRTRTFATFADRPPPGDGPLRTTVVPLSSQRAGRLVRWGLPRRATLGDVVLAASLVAGAEIWPSDRPAFVGVPVSFRRGPPRDEACRALSYQFELPPGRGASLEEALAEVAQATARARDLAQTAEQFAGRALYAFAPPAAYRGWATRLRTSADNTRETLTFTNLGLFDRAFAAFGPIAVEDVTGNASLLHPPGMRVMIVRAPQRLNVCIGWLEGPVSRSSIERFAARLDALLDVDPASKRGVS